MRRITTYVMSSALAAAVCTGAAVGHVSAGGRECAPRTLSQAFAQFGDTNDYFLVDAADFETDGKGKGAHKDWQIPKKAKVVKEQSPWKVNGPKHEKALRIDAETTVTTPEVCVKVDEEFFRFFYKDPGKQGATLTVVVTATSDRGTAQTQWATSSTGKGWQVSPPIALPNVHGETGEQQITISFITGSSKDDRWVIDDIMIDPWKSR